MKNHGLRILVVDDEPAIRSILNDLLVMEGFHSLTAKNGIDALRQMVKPLPDVVICDLQMPVMSGYEFMSVLRSRFPQIPVIAVSGQYKKGELPAYVPADAFLSKGNYLIDDLYKTIRELACAYPIRPPTKSADDVCAPVPIDSFGNLMLQCTNCLRPFQVEARGLNGGIHAAQCVSCLTSIKFEIDHLLESKVLQVVPPLLIDFTCVGAISDPPNDKTRKKPPDKIRLLADVDKQEHS
jgi:CheY-like chemotaxis protein